MFIVEVLVNLYNPYGDKMKFEFKDYSECSDFIRMVINLNKDYAYVITFDDTSNKEV